MMIAVHQCYQCVLGEWIVDPKKIILTDVDGVLLDWEWAFSVWMQERGFTLTADNKKSYYLHHHYNDLTQVQAKALVKQFNESAAIGFLPALRDSVYYVKRLHEEHGYTFHAITSESRQECTKTS
jgi:FMN phosphatase YigB (HAD superfamily)